MNSVSRTKSFFLVLCASLLALSIGFAPATQVKAAPLPPYPTGDITTEYTPDFVWNEVAGAEWYYLWVDGPSYSFQDWFEVGVDVTCASSACFLSAPYILDGGDHAWWVLPWDSVNGYGDWSAEVDFSTTIPPLPGIATLTSPTGNLVGAAPYTPNFVFSTASDAQWYYLWLDGPDGHVFDEWYFADDICTGTPTVCTVPAPASLEAGGHTWWVLAYNSSGYGDWSNAGEFTTAPYGAATLTSPTGNMATDYAPDFKWNAVAGATWYFLEVDDASGEIFSSWYEVGVDVTCPSGVCTVTSPLFFDGGDFTWWLQPWGPNGYGIWNSMDFSLDVPPLPGIATLTSPTGNLVGAAPYTPNFVFSTASDAQWYYLWLDSPDGHVLDEWYFADDICTGVTCTVTAPASLEAGGHTWWVLAYNSSGYGDWSNAGEFTTAPYGAATLTSPTGNMATDYAPDFKWNAVAGATWYFLEVDDASGEIFSSWYEVGVDVTCPSGVCTVTSPLFFDGGDFTWWLQPWGPNGYGIWNSMDFSLDVPPLPGIATLTSPTGNLVGAAPYTPNFVFSTASDAQWYYLWLDGPDGHVFDEWYFADDICTGTPTVCTVPAPASLEAGGHTWWVLAWNSAGYGDWSNAGEFTTYPLAQPVLISPIGNISTNYNPDFKWNAVPGATWYYMETEESSGAYNYWFEVGVDVTCTGSPSVCTVSDWYPSAGDATWWITPWSPAGFGPSSLGMSFTTTIPPSPGTPTLVSPTGLLGTNNPDIVWNVAADTTWYHVWIDGPGGSLDGWFSAADNCNLTTCTVAGPFLEAGDFQWWVLASNAGGDGTWSTPLSFTVPVGATDLSGDSNTTVWNKTRPYGR